MEEQTSKLVCLLLFIISLVVIRERCGITRETSYPTSRDDNDDGFSIESPPTKRHKPAKTPDVVEGLNVTCMIAGRSGTGKHTLIKSLFGGRDLESGVEIEGPLTGSSLGLEGISTNILFWSSPGLYDGFFSNQESVRKMKKQIDSLDLFLYTMRMDDTRLRPEDVLTLQQLSEAFGSILWQKCVFVLTFANRVDYLDAHQLPRRSPEHFHNRAKLWAGHIRETLMGKGIPRLVVEALPIVPAGHHTEPRLFADEEPWLRQLVKALVERVDHDVKPAIHILTSIYDHG